MSKTYTRFEGDDLGVFEHVIETWHADRFEDVRIVAMFVSDGGKQCLSLHGTPCAGTASKVSGKYQALTGCDALVLIDHFIWTHLGPESRNALIDHELTHFEVDKKKGEAVVVMRPHDVEIGAFYEVARRHGRHALEVQNVSIMLMGDERGQLLLPGFELKPSDVESEIEQLLARAAVDERDRDGAT